MEKSGDTYSLNEGQARYLLIDPALRDAGWKLEDRTQVGFEVPVDGYDAEPWNGIPKVVNLVFIKADHLFQSLLHRAFATNL